MLYEPVRLRRRPPETDHELAVLVQAAAAGDEFALGHLVGRFDRVLRGVTRSFRLGPWDADDVVQSTWLQFMRHGSRLRDPAAVAGWLVTTTRRECLKLMQHRGREQLTDEPERDVRCERAEPDSELLAAERRELVNGALAELPDRPRTLMRVLVDRPELSYEEVGRMLDMPIGSIGPTRARALDRLRDSSELCALHAAGV
jgi:RNA polymerase sigma factor (sigma-70 family)